jgi:hypothetical protein
MAEERCERENRRPRRAVRNGYEKPSMRLRAMEWSRSGERAVSKAHDAASSDGMESKRRTCSVQSSRCGFERWNGVEAANVQCPKLTMRLQAMNGVEAANVQCPKLTMRLQAMEWSRSSNCAVRNCYANLSMRLEVVEWSAVRKEKMCGGGRPSYRASELATPFLRLQDLTFANPTIRGATYQVTS